MSIIMPRNEPIALDRNEIERRHSANRLAWNEGAARYAERVEKDITFLAGGGSSLHPVERHNLGNLAEWCGTAVHLMCASGRDTLSLLNEGAREVVGIDISDRHIENARRISETLGAPARWYRCDVLEVPAELDGTADLVYTGRGALNWLHDLDAWARVVHRLLKPGGLLHLFDGHPFTWLLDTEAETVVGNGTPYFGHAESSQGWPGAYIGALDAPDAELGRKYERLWTIAEVFNALTGAGLVVERMGEHPEEYWPILANLRPELRGTLPLTFSIMARRPG